MPRRELDSIFQRVESLALEMDKFVPPEQKGVTEFRADLAGLLVVSIASSYESCVKEVLISFASRHHDVFENFARNNFDRLNSRIAIGDLHGYAKTFDESISKNFKDLINRRKNRLNERVGKNIEASYTQILRWRHDFAHAGIRNTTIEEAIKIHRIAKRVLYCFDEAFNGK